MKKLLPKLLALVLVLAGAVLYYVFDHRSVEPDDPDAPVVNPGRVSTDIPLNVASLMEVPDLSESYSPIVPHKAYVSSYNEETLIPDWVAYELTADETGGTESRGGIEFRMDPTLRGVTQAMREDYSGSGWTKGHLMPAADAAYSTTTMGETFYFTTICPQDETLNAGDWAYLEKRVRQWANRYGHIWVVTGPIVGENRYGTIGEREVVVPDSFFKALLVTGSTAFALSFFIARFTANFYSFLFSFFITLFIADFYSFLAALGKPDIDSTFIDGFTVFTGV